MRFILVSDPKSNAAPWWVIRVAKDDFDTVMNLHRWVATSLFIKDGNDPHMLAAREKEDPIAMLRHPVLLGARWIQTAMCMVMKGDFYVNSNNGMRPCGDLVEGRAIESNNWPSIPNEYRRITIHTWGNHFYLTADSMCPVTFLDKFNTEEEAMEFAKLFAPPERITVKREARQFKDGD